MEIGAGGLDARAAELEARAGELEARAGELEARVAELEARAAAGELLEASAWPLGGFWESVEATRSILEACGCLWASAEPVAAF